VYRKDEVRFVTSFQSYFTNCSVEEDTYAAVYATTPKGQKQLFLLGTGSNCSYFDGKELHQKIIRVHHNG
jgi:N-acetylglucosamine kinase-like BadF-type ATPase